MRTCVITGASSGIGRASAISISNENDYENIVLIGRNLEELNITMGLMNKKVKISLIQYDLAELEDIPTIIEGIISKYKTIDCLCNIAGYTEPKPLLQTSLDNIVKTYNVNVFAPLILIRETVKYMKDNKFGGKIINISSTAATTPRPGWISYASSKAAMNSISSTLSEELAEYHIKVYNLSPGRCATKLREKLAPDEDQSSIMQPIAVAKVISNLLKDSEQVLDGQNIIIRKKL